MSAVLSSYNHVVSASVLLRAWDCLRLNSGVRVTFRLGELIAEMAKKLRDR